MMTITTKHRVNTVESLSRGPKPPETIGGPTKSQRVMHAVRKPTAKERLRPARRRTVSGSIQRPAQDRIQASWSSPVLVSPMGRDPVDRKRGKLSDRHRRSFPHRWHGGGQCTATRPTRDGRQAPDDRSIIDQEDNRQALGRRSPENLQRGPSFASEGRLVGTRQGATDDEVGS